MKLSEQYLINLVKEELNNLHEQPQDQQSVEKEDGEDKDLVASKTKLRDKFKMLYNNIMKAKGLSKNELIAFDALLNASLQLMQGGEAAMMLKRALQKLEK